jgi:cell division protein FtsI (penicillin-binding protein 3)
MTSFTVSAVISSRRVELVNLRLSLLQLARRRLVWLLYIFALIAIAALLRISFLGLFEPAGESEALNEVLFPRRGEIVDRNGVVLALAFPAYTLWYNPKVFGQNGPPLVKSPHEVAEALVRIFPDEDLAKLITRLNSDKPGYLRRRILPEEANRIHAWRTRPRKPPRERSLLSARITSSECTGFCERRWPRPWRDGASLRQALD